MRYSMATFLMVVFCVFVSACAQKSDNGRMLEGNTTIKAIIQNPNNYDGKQVIVSGNFKGWKGSCFSAPPVTRSDWMIEEEGQCIYVSGDLPGTLDAMKPSGEEITIEATVKVDQKGKPYLVK